MNQPESYGADGDWREDNYDEVDSGALNHRDYDNMADFAPAQDDHASITSECPCCLGNPYDCRDQTCNGRGYCDCIMEEEENTELDEWIPSSSQCDCCKGFIYQCDQLSDKCEKKCACASPGGEIIKLKTEQE
jgi:hypothetical protein